MRAATQRYLNRRRAPEAMSWTGSTGWVPGSFGSGGTQGRRARPAGYERKMVHETAPYPMLYLAPLVYAEPVLQFCSFDLTYIESLCAGDRSTEDHFVSYFTALLQLKLRSRLRSPQAAEDVRQETFARVLKALRSPGGLRQPDRLGAFVNTVCNHVLMEQYRSSARSDSLDEDGQPEPVAKGASALDTVVSQQTTEKVHDVLLEMPERDRALLKAVFLDEEDRDEVCAKFGVDREYLRVLLYRAKKDFKSVYLKQNGNHVPFDMRAQEA